MQPAHALLLRKLELLLAARCNLASDVDADIDMVLCISDAEVVSVALTLVKASRCQVAAALTAFRGSVRKFGSSSGGGGTGYFHVDLVLLVLNSIELHIHPEHWLQVCVSVRQRLIDASGSGDGHAVVPLARLQQGQPHLRAQLPPPPQPPQLQPLVWPVAAAPEDAIVRRRNIFVLISRVGPFTPSRSIIT